MTKTVKDLIEKPAAKKPSLLVDSGKLASALGRIASVVTSNPIVPILDNVLMTAEDSRLTCRVSDLQVDAQVSLEVSCNTPFQCAVPVRLLLELLKSLPAQEVWFRYEPDTFTLTLEVLAGSYQLPGENPVDFPKLSKAGDVEQPIEAGLLTYALKKIAFAVSTDSLRPAMCGISIKGDGENLEFCATNTHQLATYATQNSGAFSMIVPSKLAHLLIKTLPFEGQIIISANESHVRFQWSDMLLQARLIDERYPDYQNAIPKSTPFTATIDRLALLRCVKRIILFSAEDFRISIQFQADGSIKLAGIDQERSKQGKENLSCEAYDGDELLIGFNARMLTENLSNIETSKVVLRLTAPNRAMLIEPDEQPDDGKVVQLLMPMMLNNYA